jgi:hypothetical protein
VKRAWKFAPNTARDSHKSYLDRTRELTWNSRSMKFQQTPLIDMRFTYQHTCLSNVTSVKAVGKSREFSQCKDLDSNKTGSTLFKTTRRYEFHN